MGIQNWSDDIILVNLAPEPHMAEELQTVIEVVSQDDRRNVVVDFSDVSIVTSSSIAKLLKLRKVLNDGGQSMVLSSVDVRTKKIFSIFKWKGRQFLSINICSIPLSTINIKP